MKNLRSIIALLLLLATLLACFTACKKDDAGENGPQHIDYVANTKLDMNSETLKLDVTNNYNVNTSHVDGDTTHFNRVSTSISATGILKARYLAINTPESTGRVEVWGKAASAFTKEKLSTAVSILVESDTDRWNYDGNGRFLVWVWYKPTADSEYRNLNIEILQSGLAVGSSPRDNRYGETCVAAIAQATVEKLYLHSNEKDPQYPYEGAQSITLKELRTNITEYVDANSRVAVEGVVTFNSDYTAYIEEYDPETDMYYGMQLFYGYDSKLISVLAQGNRVRVVGTVGEYHGTYQISSLTYNPMRPDDPANTSIISTGNEVAYRETTPEQFKSDVTIEIDDESKTYKYEVLAVSTSISMKGLRVIRTKRTETGTSAGAITITCEATTSDGKTVTIDVRTEVLKDSNGNTVTESAYTGKTIDVKGIIDYFDYENDGSGIYQIKVYEYSDIVIH